MCGITGIVGRLSAANRAALRRMNDAMVHRGPDGEGYWEASPDEHGWGAMLGHRRLAILDLSPTGAQPMLHQRRGHVLVTNGEIYNYVGLRERLSAEGETFQSTGDTEVMLNALARHGAAAVSTFRGMFAFGLWDASARLLTLGRDPLGIKPLYFARNPQPDGEWAVLFASEVRAILASGLMGKPRIDPRTTASIVWNGFPVAPNTAIEGIRSVLPGELLVFDDAGNLRQRLESRLPARKGTLAAEDLGRELEESVRLHLASDVPLAVFLSGGIDSTAVANLASRQSDSQVNTFTLAFEEPAYNEGPLARSIAAAIGTRHHEVVLTEAHFCAQLDTALDSLDQPTFDGLNSYYMSRAVREAGFKVALVGTGGDELFGGYASFRHIPGILKWLRLLGVVPSRARSGLAKVALRLLGQRGHFIPPQTRWAKLPDVLAGDADLITVYQLAYALFLPEFQRELVGPAVTGLLRDGLPEEVRERISGSLASRSSLSSISVLEQHLFLGERLLPDTDAASMAASIELRLPLVDSVLWEAADRLTDQEKYQPVGKKAALRKIGLRGLSEGLFGRSKSGFVLPFDVWLRKGLHKAIDAVLSDPVLVRPTGLNPQTIARLWNAYSRGAPGIYWTRIWAIYVYVRWCHRHRAFAA